MIIRNHNYHVVIAIMYHLLVVLIDRKKSHVENLHISLVVLRINLYTTIVIIMMLNKNTLGVKKCKAKKKQHCKWVAIYATKSFDIN